MDNKPVSKRRRKPTEGLGERMILFNSAAILSWEIIPILSLYFLMPVWCHHPEQTQAGRRILWRASF